MTTTKFIMILLFLFICIFSQKNRVSMMSYDDFDSDGAATGERRYNKSQSNYRSSTSSNQKASILKNSPLRRSNQFSDDEDDNYTANSGRVSNRNRLGNNDSPLNSYRSESASGKPPSGRLMPMQSMSGGGNAGLGSRDRERDRERERDRDRDRLDRDKDRDRDRDFRGRNTRDDDYSNSKLGKREEEFSTSKKSLPSISYSKNSINNNNNNDSDDAYTDPRFTKKSGGSLLSNDSKYDNKTENKYDRFDKKSELSSLPKYDRFDYSNKDESISDKNNDSKYDRFSDSKKNADMKYDRFDIPITKKDTIGKYDRFDIDKNNSGISSSYNTPKISNNLDKFEKFENKYDSKFDTKYDTYDEDEPKSKHSDLSNKYFRSEGPLKTNTTSKADPLDSLDLYSSSKNIMQKSQRSNSLDRIHSAYNQLVNTTNTLGSSSGGRLSKFNSTSNLNGIDNSSDRSYTVTSLTSANLSIKEAKNNRSYLVGSLSAINGKGLLSTDELERNLVEKRARVLVATWNMGGAKKLSDNLDELLLPEMIQTMPDIYVIGVQEFELNHKDWEISLQEQIGPAHVKFTSYYYGSIGVCVFIKRELIWFCSTGEGNIEHRIENYKTTINSIKLPNKLLTKNRLLATDGTDNFDCVFWMGDFNFRVDKERNKVVDKLVDIRKKKSINYEDIMNHDELNRVIDEDKAFKNFIEGRITFEPTYKYELNSDEYDKSDKCRIPSYTDRILFRSRQKGIISCSFYDSVKEIKISDHRPVYGVYEVQIRPGVDTIPLSYGEFDRQVYQAGYQKRQMFRACDVGFTTKNTKTKKSSPCSIQ